MIIIAVLAMIGMVVAYLTGQTRSTAIFQSFQANAYRKLMRRVDAGEDPVVVALDEFHPDRLAAWTYRDTQALLAERTESPYHPRR